MPLAEGVSASIRYKAYSTGVITANTEPTSTADPGQSGGQILRRVASTLKLGKDTYQSNEIASHRQLSDFRHGTRRVSGNISGEFSPLTYKDFLEASFRGTWAAAVSASQADFTSVAADNTTSKFTFASGDPVTKGYRVGMVIQFASLSDADNNAKNFVILAFSSASNRDVTVYPAPDTMGADSAFTMASVGKTLIVPASSHVSRKFGIEIFNDDIDVSRLFTECRLGGFNMQLPATGLATIEFPTTGRDMELRSGSTNVPFFTAPASETTTGIFAAVNGLIRVNGVNQGVITGMNVQMNLNPSADPVVGQNFVPEVFLGRALVTGQLTAFFEDGSLVNNFVNEDEIAIIAYLTTSNAIGAPANVIYMPRVKFGDADIALAGEGGQQITMPYQALKSGTTAATSGIEDTTIQIADTQVV